MTFCISLKFLRFLNNAKKNVQNKFLVKTINKINVTVKPLFSGKPPLSRILIFTKPTSFIQNYLQITEKLFGLLRVKYRFYCNWDTFKYRLRKSSRSNIMYYKTKSSYPLFKHFGEKTPTTPTLFISDLHHSIHTHQYSQSNIKFSSLSYEKRIWKIVQDTLFWRTQLQGLHHDKLKRLHFLKKMNSQNAAFDVSCPYKIQRLSIGN